MARVRVQPAAIVLDDDDPAGDVKGWVDLLVERLPRLISSTLGYQPKIWRDERSLTGDALLRARLLVGSRACC